MTHTCCHRGCSLHLTVLRERAREREHERERAIYRERERERERERRRERERKRERKREKERAREREREREIEKHCLLVWDCMCVCLWGVWVAYTEHAKILHNQNAHIFTDRQS